MTLLLLLGIAAGALTTIAGLGGGQLLVLTLVATGDARTALVLASPALLAGNLHRAWTFRHAVDRRVVVSFVSGALPGSLLAGGLTAALPVWVVHAVMLATTAASIARATGVWKPRFGAVAMAPAGLGIGILSAGTGTGLLVAPLLLAHGLSGAAYLATSSWCAAAMHAGRISGYAFGDLLDGPTLARSAVLAAGIIAGNLVGERARRHIPARAGTFLEQGVLVLCVVLALAGLV